MHVLNNYKFTIVCAVVGFNVLPYYGWLLFAIIGYIIDYFFATRQEKSMRGKEYHMFQQAIRKINNNNKLLTDSLRNERVYSGIKCSDNQLVLSKALLFLTLLSVLFSILYNLFLTVVIVQDNSHYLYPFHKILEFFVNFMKELVPIVGNIPESANDNLVYNVYSDNYILFYQHIYAVNWLLALIFVSSIVLAFLLRQWKEITLGYSICYSNYSKKSILWISVFAIIGLYSQFVGNINFDRWPINIGIFIFGTSALVVALLVGVIKTIIYNIMKWGSKRD